MIPSLARRGKLILASGALLVMLGALYDAAPLVALGAVVISSLLSAYLWFFPAAILLRRRKVELSWWLPPGDQPGGALTADHPFQIHIALRNHGARRLRVLNVQLLGTSALDLPQDLEAVVPARHQVEITGRARSRAVGYQVLHGAVLHFGDILGLFELRAFFPNPIAVKVFPAHSVLRANQILRPSGSPMDERVGPHQLRRRGLAGELREIRDHSHGDPFKFIAWKATARRKKLMVRDLESEIVITHLFALDMSSTMRDGPPGSSKLDFAIESTAALARAALDGGDRVGLATYDTRLYSELRPGEGHQHYLKLLDRLLETRNVVDEDLTELTAGELTQAAARYLAHQEAVDVRVTRVPALDDPAWEKIQAGPSGELYDIEMLDRVVSNLLKTMGRSARRSLAPAWWWSRVHIAPDSDPVTAKLRVFCRLRGLELPYRREPGHGARSAGLAATMSQIRRGPRVDSVILFSDLGGIEEDPDTALKALASARLGGCRLVVVSPYGPGFHSEVHSYTGSIVADVLSQDQRRRFERASRLLARQGIPVIAASPSDGIGLLFQRIARARSGVRRAA